MATHPVTANGDVENDVERALAEGLPHGSIANIRARDSVEHLAIHGPGNRLALPRAALAVEINSPNVIASIGDVGSVDNARWLVADTALGHVAVDTTISKLLAVDVFQDIDFSASRPFGTLSIGVAENPESRPKTLLVDLGVAAEAEFRLDSGDLACGRREGVFRFDASGSPLVGSRCVVAGDQLKRALPADAHVLVRLGVSLIFGVAVLIARDEIPLGRARQCFSLSGEIGGPNLGETRVGGRRQGECNSKERKKNGKDALVKHGHGKRVCSSGKLETVNYCWPTTNTADKAKACSCTCI